MKRHYEAEDITVLEGLEAVRKRPGMYIGSTSLRGLHHLVYEIIDNSVDEALAGYCDHIDIKILPENIIELSDNGRGIPVGMHPKHNKSALEIIMTVLHAGGKFEKNGYKVSGGLHGVGASVVNALSTWCEVEVRRAGKVWYQKYNIGKPEEAVKEIRDMTSEERTGTTTRFKADENIFESIEYEMDVLSARIRELAYLNRGLKISIEDHREEELKREEFFKEGGIVDFIEEIDIGDKKLMEKPIYMNGEEEDVIVEIAIMYTTAQRESIYSFVNNINTHEGGTHVSGFKTALTRAVNEAGKAAGLIKVKQKQNLEIQK